MALKVLSLVSVVLLLNCQGGLTWPSNPWFNAYQAIKLERQGTSLLISSINRQVSFDIAERIATIRWTLDPIKYSAEFAETECAKRTLAEIETFYQTMYLIHECRNNGLVDTLRGRQMQQLDAEILKVKEAEVSCGGTVNYQQCADQITAEVQARMLAIREETQAEVSRISEGNAACVQQRGDEMSGIVQEIKGNWQNC